LTERWKIEQECDEIISNESYFGHSTNVREKMKDIDQWYLQKLFRSDTIQTVGLHNAPDGAIIRALYKVVPSLCFSEDMLVDLSKKSIEFVTAYAMNKWSRYDSSGLKADETRSANHFVPSKTSPPVQKEYLPSIYNEFCSVQKETPDMSDDSDDGHGMSDVELKSNLIRMHHQRWKKLLLAVNNEEAKLLSSLVFFSFPTNSDKKTILVTRSGIVSTILLSEPYCSDSPCDEIDSIAMSIHEQIEVGSPKNRCLLASIEVKAWEMISKAQLLKTDVSMAFIKFVRTAISDFDSEGWHDIHSKISCNIEKMTEEEANKAIEDYTELKLTNENITKIIIALTGYTGK
jgi:hypothetical protein